MTREEVRGALQAFANEHKVIFQDQGEVGFGRPCVGFVAAAGGYVDVNPYRYVADGTLNPPMEQIAELADDGLYAPLGVRAYHKHDCLAVLVEDGNYVEAEIQLYQWVQRLNERGVEIVQYLTGATGMQAVMTGVIGYAVKAKEAKK